MSATERKIILGGFVLVVLLLLFPPWRFTTEIEHQGSRVKFDSLVGFHSLFAPPVPSAPMLTTTSVDLQRLSVSVLAIVVLDGMAVWLLRSGRLSQPRMLVSHIAEEPTTRRFERGGAARSFRVRMLWSVPVLLTIAVAAKIVSHVLTSPQNVTFGFHVAAVVLPLFTYTIIIAAVAAVIGCFGLMNVRSEPVPSRFKRVFTSSFAWIFLIATIFDFAVSAYESIFVLPRVRNALTPPPARAVAPLNSGPVELPTSELAKLVVTANPQFDHREKLDITVYNGSSYDLDSLTVEITAEGSIPLSPEQRLREEEDLSKMGAEGRMLRSVFFGVPELVSPRKYRADKGLYESGRALQTSHWTVELGVDPLSSKLVVRASSAKGFKSDGGT